MITLSQHFCDNWRSRVGGEPDKDAVIQSVLDSVVVQKGRFYFDMAGNRRNLLTILWNADLNVVMTADHVTGTMVSVLTPPVCDKWRVCDAIVG